MAADPVRVAELVARYRAGDLSAEEADELARLLREGDPMGRAELDRSGLAGAALTGDDLAFAARVVGRLPHRAPIWPWAAIAVAAAMAVGLAWWRSAEPAVTPARAEDPTLAIVASGSAVGADGVVIAAGAHLGPGDTARTAPGGALALRWSDGTTVDLAGDSLLGLVAGSGNRLRLERGALTVAAAALPPSAPLLIETPLATATVLGTRFTLAADATATRLDVAHGRVRLADNDTRAIEVGAGWHGEIAQGLPPCLVPTLAAASVTVGVGDDLQRAIDAHPPGTVFRIAAGIHRLAQGRPKDGDAFIGEPGAVLRGAAELSGFARDDQDWSAHAPRASEPAHGKILGDDQTAARPEELFLDDRPLTRVATQAELSPGRWRFDDEAGLVRLADDPTGHRVELSLAPVALGGGAANVSVVDLTVERYANPAQAGAIGGQEPGAGWTVSGSRIRRNHGAGAATADGWRLLRCELSDNGQLGVNGVGAGLLLLECEIARNARLGFDPDREGGGASFSRTRDLIARGNAVVGNRGPGLLLTHGDGARIEENTVTGNARCGIGLHECAHAVVRANRARGNGLGFDRWPWGAQILARDAQAVEIDGNRIEVDARGGDGIALIQQDIEDRLARDCWIHDNDVVFHGAGGRCGGVADWNADGLWRGGNRFDRNRYHAADPRAKHWEWGGEERGFAEFRAFGFEAHGALLGLDDKP